MAMFCFRYCTSKIISSAFLFIAIAKLAVYGIRQFKRKGDRRTIGFFHPYCDAGGGGERVLWVFIEALLNHPEISEKVHIVLYSGEKKTASELFANVEKKFGIILSVKQQASVTVVDIQSRFLLEAKWYPVLTMLGQSLGSVVVGLECLLRSSSLPCESPVPDIFCDTTGAAFTYVAARVLFHCTVIPYVHYPTISSDMLQRVRDMRPTYNNSAAITNSAAVSSAKLLYYHIFAWLYAIVLNCTSSLLVVNGSWTENHIRHLLDNGRATNGRRVAGGKIRRVFPPCNTEALLLRHGQTPTTDTRTEPDYVVVNNARKSRVGSARTPGSASSVDTCSREPVVVSIGQFRPEKDQLLQIRAFHRMLRDRPELRAVNSLRLIIVGSVRNEGDEAIAERCRNEIALLHEDPTLSAEDRGEIDFAGRVELKINAPFNELVALVHEVGAVGLHTMWNEHFGISVVEMQAAGLLTVAHASGGPGMDIITAPAYATDIGAILGTAGAGELRADCNGFLASSEEDYASCLAAALHLFMHRNSPSASSNAGPVSYASIVRSGREAVGSRFSDKTFKKEMCALFEPFILG